MSKFRISQQEVRANIAKIREYMSQIEVDGFYISSFDKFLNEYVPMRDNHRYYFTGFTGSTAEVFIPKDGKPRLYVDGRYHEQADNEVDLNEVHVVKVKGYSLYENILDDIDELKISKLALEAQRCSVSFYEKLKNRCDVLELKNDELSSKVSFEKNPKLNEITYIAKELRGSDTSEKLTRIFQNKKNQAYYVSAIDSVSWITNCRGYHLPFASSFLATALVTCDKVFVFTDKETPISGQAQSQKELQFLSFDQLEQTLQEKKSEYSLETLYYDSSMLNVSDFLTLKNIFSDQMVNKPGGLVEFHSIKEETEIFNMKESFKRADKAIFNTLKWVKDSVAKGEKVSELDLYHKTSENYKAQGALEQSFNTIAGVGASGSIIHYGDPKSDVYVDKDSMILLDSGGYFESGFATDTTRTFIAGDKASDEFKKMYTLVLKGTLACQHAVFPEGTLGSALDMLARKSLYEHGMNYAHGTGHGVGIHVHEPGVRISPVSTVPMKAGQVVSIEPGYYKLGVGGVRIENIALVKKHPQFDGFLCFEPLVYIGYEHALIDQNLLTDEEKQWISEYEAVCKQRGTSFQ